MSTNITWHEGSVTREERETLLRQKGLTIWFTGLSASGKSTLASALEQALLHVGVASYRLDGDNIRFGLNKNLGFGPEDRTENIRRIAEVGWVDWAFGSPSALAGNCLVMIFPSLFTSTLHSTLVAITAFISPYREDRDSARKLHEDNGIPFVEVYVDVPLSVVEARDPKGLYKKAKAGEIKEFTGISAPYEEPLKPEVRVRTDEVSVEQGVKMVIDYLVEKGYVAASRFAK
ncbi:adenylylsulfate kinase [Jimgerdemannia flammicorona]|uniref:ATP adenosine-5'-phosphosulfate 3'-phosphotransferase n=2 Tax=Jimgerdemannia flammicorona TaxID=994334 RepID=A0A433QK20_9FUNG|nr:adenylylsulfate kinase [Jimgerdemannia flammicorona]RUS30106.1 hypothetical protein BC938DRAFT_479841 [Jimgerdemannia flammicorona]